MSIVSSKLYIALIPPHPPIQVNRQFYLYISSNSFTLKTLQLRLLLHLAYLQLRRIFLQHTLVMVFPELLRRVLARHTLQNLASARVFVDEL